MRRKAIIALCGALILCALSGCQLARENAGADAREDRLAGVFVTTEYLDLFDFEGYMNDNLKGFSGGEIIMDGDTEKYQGRLYAALTTKTLTNEETGETIETEEYVFEGVEGIPYFAAVMQATAQGGDAYTASVSDPAISDAHMAINVGDAENSTALEGTIYVSPAREERTYYFNPVYQSADGSVYLTSGSGFMVGNWPTSEGEQYSQTMDASYTETENGKSKTERISVKLSIGVMFAPEKIVVLQMDAQSKLLSRTERAPGELPEVFSPEPDAEYLVVETHKRDAEGNATVSREIVGKDAESMETFCARADGVCEKRWTQIKWPGQ